MSGFIRGRVLSFRYAFAGCWYMLRTQPNAWIHALASLAVLAVGLWLGLERLEWALITLAIVIVWTAEFINTALEALIDLASPQQHPLAKAGKDVSAAAVLVAAGGSIVIGLIVLGPPLWLKLGQILAVF
jgi:diacylglycerol kinase